MELKLNIKDIVKGAFGTLPEAQINAIVSQLEYKEIKKGNILFNEGELDQSFTLIVKGKISIQKKKFSGSENQTLLFLKGGEYFCSHEGFLGLANQTSSFARSNSLIALLKNESIKHLIGQFPELTLKFLDLGAKEASLLEKSAANLVTLPIKLRFLDSLKTLLNKYGEHYRDHYFIPITREEIGKYINASKASLSRVISELESDNLIKSERQGIKIFNPQMLFSEIS